MNEPPTGPTEFGSGELPSTADADGPPPEDGQIGPYRLLQRLGEGGMGEVWLADQQEPVRRRVALKIIRRGLDTAQELARFEAERQALALMNHSAVARVFDAGKTPLGRPYLVMEYVQGVALNEHCDRQRLTTRERLELFVRVCDGVQHAHQKAVIHRDLKPSNVLVAMQDGQAVPKIIDFGVAKATSQRLTERTLFTELGALIGTPEYMSPEQAEMTGQDVDTRTDVYALGVMLYQLLVGALPFDSKELRAGSFDEIRRRIREEDPKRPSARLSTLGAAGSTESARRRQVDVATLKRQLTGELDWIVMKAVEKDRLRRYGSPSELAADIERYLEDQPVLAGRPSARYKAAKFVKRHRIGVAFASVAVLGLAGFAFAMTLQSARIARERDRANREAATANRALEFLTDLFEVSDPGEARGSTVTAREILDRGAAKIDTELADEPIIRAKLEATLGEVYKSLGLYDSATPLLESTLKLRRETLGPDHPETLRAVDELGLLLLTQGRFAEAEPFLRDALDDRRRLLGDEHVDTLTSMNNLGLLLQQSGRLREAEPLLREALAAKRKTLGDADPEILPTLNNLGVVLQAQGKFAEAEPYLRELLDRCRRTLGADHPHTLTAVNNVGLVLQSQGKLADAEPFWREALESRRRVLGNDHPQTLLSAYSMGFLLRGQGRLDESEAHIREAMEGFARVLGKDHPRTLMARNGMGMLLQSQGRLKEAESMMREAFEERRRVLGDDHPDTIDSIQAFGSVLQEEDRLDDAARTFQDAVERSLRTLGAEHSTTLNAQGALADILASQGRLEEAERLLADVCATARRALPPGHRVIGRALRWHGRCLTGLGRFSDAEAALLEAREILAKADTVAVPKVARDLTELYTRWGKPDDAASWKAHAAGPR